MSKKLLLLNGLAILGVVANHASHKGFIALFWWTDRYRPVSVPNYDAVGSLSYYGLVAAQKLALFCVPSFLFVTGVFIAYAARGSDAKLSWSIVRRRILNLLPPYLVWILLFFIGSMLIHINDTPAGYVKQILGINDSQYFYIPVLILFYLISPWIVPLAKKRWSALLFAAVIIHFIGLVQHYVFAWAEMAGRIPPTIPLYQVSSLYHALEFFLYYALGLILGFHLSAVKASLYRLRKWLLLALVVTAALSLVETEWLTRATGNDSWRSMTLTLPTTLFALSAIFTFLAFEHVNLPFSRWLYQIGSASLGIYLIHPLILLYMPKFIYHLLPGMLAYQSIFILVLVAAGVFGPILLMSITRWLPVRKTYRLLYG